MFQKIWKKYIFFSFLSQIWKWPSIFNIKFFKLANLGPSGPLLLALWVWRGFGAYYSDMKSFRESNLWVLLLCLVWILKRMNESSIPDNSLIELWEWAASGFVAIRNLSLNLSIKLSTNLSLHLSLHLKLNLSLSLSLTPE